jgi:uncharacterized protein (TIGR03437 family)
MRRTLGICSCFISMNIGTLIGQGITLVGMGYDSPSSKSVAPGQIITLFLSGAKTVLPPSNRSQKAMSVPLPLTLAGFSAVVHQNDPQGTYPVPILSVSQRNVCVDTMTTSPDCLITLLTIQMPFETNATLERLMQTPGRTELIVSENGVGSKPFMVPLASAEFHIVTDCDFQVPRDLCRPAVTHADGTRVTADSPAKPGEVVVIYALGLGATRPLVKSGEPTPTPPPVLSGFRGFSRPVFLRFDFFPNAGPSPRYFTFSPPVIRPIEPLFVGLTPGQVGLYQINVEVPDMFPSILPCGVPPNDNGITSNLTIDIGGETLTFDGAPICVQPMQ